MILYHGSRQKLNIIKPHQAGNLDNPDETTLVPERELLNATYFTTEFDFAFAMAARPEGVTQINEEKRTIEFEHPELFNPEMEVYIYEIEDKDIPQEHLKRIDHKQYAVVGMAEIKPKSIQTYKARELLKYYELVNWQKQIRPKELGKNLWR